MENIVNKLISDILLMNAVKSIDNLQNLPADIAAEISNLLEELDYSIYEIPFFLIHLTSLLYSTWLVYRSAITLHKVV